MINITRLASLLFLGTLAGCGGQGQTVVHPTTGQVWVGTKPAIHARVVLHPLGAAAKEGPRPVGTVAADGTFRLTTFAKDDGAPAGEYAVAIAWTVAVPTNRPDETVTKNLLPARYGKPETSGLRVVVEPGKNELQPFRLAVR